MNLMLTTYYNMLGGTSEGICKRKQSCVWNVQLYPSAENEKEKIHILYKIKYGNEIGNPEFNLHVHNIPRQKKKCSIFLNRLNSDDIQLFQYNTIPKKTNLYITISFLYIRNVWATFNQPKLHSKLSFMVMHNQS